MHNRAHSNETESRSRLAKKLHSLKIETSPPIDVSRTRLNDLELELTKVEELIDAVRQCFGDIFPVTTIGTIGKKK